MKFALVLKWLGHETGLWIGKGGEAKFKLIHIELVVLTIGIQLSIGIW